MFHYAFTMIVVYFIHMGHSLPNVVAGALLESWGIIIATVPFISSKQQAAVLSFTTVPS